MKRCLVCKNNIHYTMYDCEPCPASRPNYSNWHKFTQIEIDKNIKIAEVYEYEKHLTLQQLKTIKSKLKSGKYLFISNTWNLLNAWTKGYIPLLFNIEDSYISYVRKSGALSFIKNI